MNIAHSLHVITNEQVVLNATSHDLFHEHTHHLAPYLSLLAESKDNVQKRTNMAVCEQLVSIDDKIKF